jgi:hypothetical protein
MIKSCDERRCQQKLAAQSWSDLIAFTEAKIREMQDSLKVFRKAMERGDPWYSTQLESQNSDSCHSV